MDSAEINARNAGHCLRYGEIAGRRARRLRPRRHGARAASDSDSCAGISPRGVGDTSRAGAGGTCPGVPRAQSTCAPGRRGKRAVRRRRHAHPDLTRTALAPARVAARPRGSRGPHASGSKRRAPTPHPRLAALPSRPRSRPLGARCTVWRSPCRRATCATSRLRLHQTLLLQPTHQAARPAATRAQRIGARPEPRPHLRAACTLTHWPISTSATRERVHLARTRPVIYRGKETRLQLQRAVTTLRSSDCSVTGHDAPIPQAARGSHMVTYTCGERLAQPAPPSARAPNRPWAAFPRSSSSAA